MFDEKNKRGKGAGFFPGEEGRTQLLLLGCLFLSCLIMFRSYLFGNEIMVFHDIGSDTWEQYIMNYTSIVNHLRDGTFSFWDFTNGFGVNVFNFNLFDPSLMLLYLIGFVLGPAHMLIYLNWIQVLKILLAGWMFYRFLSSFSFSRHAKLIAAYAYGLNGYLLVWGQHYQFGMAVIYLPLMLLFCEKAVRREKGRGWFPVTVFLSGIYSVYLTYMSLIAVGFYLLFRVLMIGGLNRRERIQRFLSGCAQILLGIGMSMAVFLPMANVLMHVSSRLDGDSVSLVETLKSGFTPYHRKFYESLLKRLFSNNLQNGYGMDKGPQKYMLNYYEDPVVCCSALAVFLNVQFLAVFWKSKEPKRVKITGYAAAALCVLTVVLPVGGTVFNSFTLPTQRYTYVLMPFFLLMVAWMWDYLKQGNKISILMLAAVWVLMSWAYYAGYQQAGFAEYRRNILIITIAGEMMALSLLVLRFAGNRRLRTAVMGVLALALAVNLISEGGMNYTARPTLKKVDTPVEQMDALMARYEEDRKSEDKLTRYRAEVEKPQDYFRELYRADLKDALDYLEEKDQEFYRVEKDYISATVSMDASAQGYRGISSYNSVMNGNVKEFVETCYPELFYADHNHYTFWNHTEDNWLAAFLGIRYIISGNGEPDSSKYTLLDKVGSIYLHENVLDAEMAHFYETAISEDSLKELCTEETRETLLGQAIALEDGTEIQDVSEIAELKSGKEETEEKESAVILNAPVHDSLITGKIQAASDGYVLFMIPYEQGWRLEIDGEEQELVRGDLGFLACRTEAGEHDLVLTFHAPMLKEGIILSVVFWLLFFILKNKRVCRLFR